MAFGASAEMASSIRINNNSFESFWGVWDSFSTHTDAYSTCYYSKHQNTAAIVSHNFPPLILLCVCVWVALSLLTEIRDLGAERANDNDAVHRSLQIRPLLNLIEEGGPSIPRTFATHPSCARGGEGRSV